MAQYKVRALVELEYLSDDQGWPEGANIRDAEFNALDEDGDYLISMISADLMKVKIVKVETEEMPIVGGTK